MLAFWKKIVSFKMRNKSKSQNTFKDLDNVAGEGHRQEYDDIIVG